MIKRKRFNEGKYDISADVYQWFNKHCCDVLDADKRHGLDNLKYNLEDADVSMFADEAMDVLVSDYGWSSSEVEDYRDQIEYDIEKLIEDTLDQIERSPVDLSFNKNNADWMDRYRDNDVYTSSLESRKRNLKNLRLEQRIARLERLLCRH